jgi:hypothetical protein
VIASASAAWISSCEPQALQTVALVLQFPTGRFQQVCVVWSSSRCVQIAVLVASAVALMRSTSAAATNAVLLLHARHSARLMPAHVEYVESVHVLKVSTAAGIQGQHRGRALLLNAGDYCQSQVSLLHSVPTMYDASLDMYGYLDADRWEGDNGRAGGRL